MFTPGWTEMIILGMIALLLFGKRLPEVARSLGQGFVEFKRGMRTIETDMRSAVYSDPQPTAPKSTSSSRVDEDLKPTAEKFQIEDETQEETADSSKA
ncbi:Sec-independent protein translocase subunit TatA/TatB [Rubinisphaera margarita]|uniref:Sec-independent protein translocase subunit TatA/TatB n=1 Tax=Rubinisphaera margarita TaxID=2909586 RepID=UPI001EE86A90|nr:twin-arginine translocase TatA/TatE family subunit [Rubinisphaera margarita]MCG6155828.1 twin-arginine translocase TatA/TatE family subunit [Rubinisphaera margarita]